MLAMRRKRPAQSAQPEKVISVPSFRRGCQKFKTDYWIIIFEDLLPENKDYVHETNLALSKSPLFIPTKSNSNFRFRIHEMKIIQ